MLYFLSSCSSVEFAVAAHLTQQSINAPNQSDNQNAQTDLEFVVVHFVDHLKFVALYFYCSTVRQLQAMHSSLTIVRPQFSPHSCRLHVVATSLPWADLLVFQLGLTTGYSA